MLIFASELYIRKMRSTHKTKRHLQKTPLRVSGSSKIASYERPNPKWGSLSQFLARIQSKQKVTEVNMSTETSVVRLRLAKERQALGRSGTKSSSHRLRGSKSALGEVQVKGVRILFTAVQR